MSRDVGIARAWILEAERIDIAMYAAIARTPTPALDVAIRASLARGRLFAHLVDLRRAPRARGGRDRSAGRRRGARLARRHCDGRQRRDEAARAAASPRSGGARGAIRASGADADLALVSLRARRLRVRVRDRRRQCVAGGGRAAARACRVGRVLARPYRRALPRRRPGRRHDRNDARAARTHSPGDRDQVTGAARKHSARTTFTAILVNPFAQRVPARSAPGP